METIKLENGKYEFRWDDKAPRFDCLRHGEPWRDLTGDKAVYSLFCFAQNLAQNVAHQATLPQINWVKNNPDEHQWFEDGSKFLVALQVNITRCEGDPRPSRQWEFAVVQVSCDERSFDLRYEGCGEFYDAWQWQDFEYFALLEGAMPTKRPEGV